MMRRSSAFVCLLCLPFLAPASAEDGGPARLTPELAVEQALANHPSVQQQRERLREFRALRGQALSSALPTIDASASVVRSRDPGLLNSPNFSELAGDVGGGFDPSFLRPIPVTIYDYRLNVEQTLYAFGRIGAAVQSAEIREQQIREEIRAAEIDAGRRAVEALYDLALAVSQLDVLAAERAAREKQLEQASDALEIGTGTRLALLQAKSALAELRPREIQADGAVEDARVALNEALGRSPLAPATPAEDLLDDPRLEELPALERLLVLGRERPDLTALRTGRRAVDQERRVWRAALLPDLKFSGSYGISSIFTEELTNTDFASWNAGIFFEWSLFDGRQTGNKLEELASQQRQSEWQERALLGEIERDLARAAVEYRRARMAAQAAVESVAAAEETERVAEANYAWGAATPLDLLNAHQAVRSARFSRLSAVHDALVARAEVLALTGRLPTESLPQETDR